MKTTLRYVLPLTIFLFLLPNRSPAPIIYREGEGIVPSEVQDIEIKKNAQEQFDLAQRYEENNDFARAGASYRLMVRRFPRADIAPTAQFNIRDWSKNIREAANSNRLWKPNTTLPKRIWTGNGSTYMAFPPSRPCPKHRKCFVKS